MHQTATGLGVIVGVLAACTSAAEPRAAQDTDCSTQQLEARSSHSLAFDAGIRKVVLFGGTANASSPFATTLWAWDGARWSCLAKDGPPGRMDAMLAYDVARQKLVLFGGRVISGGNRMTYLRDTWEWDGQRWTRADTAGPAPRIHAGMSFVPERGRVVVAGGVDADAVLRDAWEWTGSTWQKLDWKLPASGSFLNSLHTLNNSAAIVFAQRDDACSDGFRARLFAVVADTLAARDATGPCYSPQAPASNTQDGVLLFAGWEPQNAPAATYTHKNGEWRQAGAGPARRKGAAAAYDEARQRVVLYGGDDDLSINAETWEFDGQEWSNARP